MLILYLIMHMNAVWQSLCVCATENLHALLKFTVNFVPPVVFGYLIWVGLKIKFQF